MIHKLPALILTLAVAVTLAVAYAGPRCGAPSMPGSVGVQVDLRAAPPKAVLPIQLYNLYLALEDAAEDLAGGTGSKAEVIAAYVAIRQWKVENDWQG